jgi:beta-phosphoglucomutase
MGGNLREIRPINFTKPKLKIMIKAFIFDMDGTIIDSTQMDYDAWQKVMLEYDAEISYEDYIARLGAKSSEIAKEYLDVDEDEIDKLITRREGYFKEMVEQKGIKFIPQVEQILQEIRNAHLKTALATGANREKLKFMFGKLPLEQYFDVFVTADDVDTGKPDPEIFLQAAQKLGVDPNQCVVMEDASNGVEAARSGGMRCIAITTTRGADQLQGADLILEGYHQFDLLHWLEAQHTRAGGLV